MTLPHDAVVGLWVVGSAIILIGVYIVYETVVALIAMSDSDEDTDGQAPGEW